MLETSVTDIEMQPRIAVMGKVDSRQSSRGLEVHTDEDGPPNNVAGTDRIQPLPLESSDPPSPRDIHGLKWVFAGKLREDSRAP
jgi:hypothetical protein